MKSIIRIAQVKFVPELFKVKENHARLMEVLDEVKEHQPDVVITPECFLEGLLLAKGGAPKGKLEEIATVPETSPIAKDVARWAADNHSWFILGCCTSRKEGIFNSAIIYNREGNLIDIYDKVHAGLVPGNRLPVFDSDFGPFGVLICADRRWPETVRTLALKGARIILNPTWGMHDAMNFNMMRTRSFESEIIIAFTHPQLSLVTGPRRMIYRNDEEDFHRYSVVDVDLSDVDNARARPGNHLSNRRPDVYEL